MAEKKVLLTKSEFMIKIPEYSEYCLSSLHTLFELSINLALEKKTNNSVYEIRVSANI